MITRFWFLTTLLCFVLIIYLSFIDISVFGDQGYYVNSNAAFNADEFPDLESTHQLLFQITTSSKYLSGTKGAIFTTFIGSFSNSGPHIITGGHLQKGSTSTVTISLLRPIGDLKTIFLEANSTDGWLPSAMSCSMNSVKYEMAVPMQWLDVYDPVLAAIDPNGNGYEPDFPQEIFASSTMNVGIDNFLTEIDYKNQYY
eukprot:gene6317-8702_t